jgi:hypothetical protein
VTASNTDAHALREALASGPAVATGAFGVDRDKAREKLRHFQLADPCAWLLEAVRAAVVAGATDISVVTSGIPFDMTRFLLFVPAPAFSAFSRNAEAGGAHAVVVQSARRCCASA